MQIEPAPVTKLPVVLPDLAVRWPPALLGYFLPVAAGVAGTYVGAPNPPGVVDLAVSLVVAIFFAASLVLVHGLLWFHLGSRVLGAASSVSTSIRLVGDAFLRPGLVACIAVLLPLAISQSEQASKGPQFWRGLQTVIGAWAMVRVVLAARRANSFHSGQTAVFILWFLGLLVGGVFLLRLFR